jgi:hypothetical protein
MSVDLAFCFSGKNFAYGLEEIAESERLGQPSATAFLQELLRSGAGDVTRDEDDLSGEIGHRFLKRSEKRHAIDARHFQVTHDQVVLTHPDAAQAFFAVPRAIDDETGVSQGFGDSSGKCRFVFEDKNHGTRQRRESRQRTGWLGRLHWCATDWQLDEEGRSRTGT